VILRPRKLLAAAPFLAAALAGCGTTSAPAARATVVRAPVTAPAAAATPLVLSEAAPAAESKDGPAPQIVPVAAATPMCDSRGRPLSGNVRTKSQERACTADELLTASVTPETE
jgi:hypothetical protein